MKKIYTGNCANCGCRLVRKREITEDTLCPKCYQAYYQREVYRERFGEKMARKRKKKTSEMELLFADVRALDKYNEEHGTRYSYGQARLKGII